MPVFKKITKYLSKLRRKKKKEEKKATTSEKEPVEKQREPDEEENDDYRSSYARRSTAAGRRSSFGKVSGDALKREVTPDTLPIYQTIGWEAKRCLNKGYDISAWHIDCTTNTKNWLNIFSFGDGEPKMSAVSGGVGVRETFGIFEMSQNWQTDGWIGTLGANMTTAYGLLSYLFKCAYLTDDK